MQTPQNEPNWTRNFLPLPASQVQVPLIIRPLKVPCHTYITVALKVYLNDAFLFKVCLMPKKKRIWAFSRQPLKPFP